MLHQLFSSPFPSFLGKVPSLSSGCFYPRAAGPRTQRFGGASESHAEADHRPVWASQEQEVLHSHYFLIQWISAARAEQTRARAKDSSLPNECLCHGAVSPITVFPSHRGPPGSAPAGCSAGDGHRQRAALAAARAARLPVYAQ